MLDLVIASSHGLGLTDLDRQRLARLAATRTPPAADDTLRQVG